MLVLTPTAGFIVVCFKVKNDTQIKVAGVLSSVFAFVMIMVIIGTISRTLNSSVICPSSLIMYTLCVIFLIAGILHPSEFKCLFSGLLYFLCLPSAFVLLNIYAIINLNNISWGTREIIQPNSLGTKDLKGKKSQLPTDHYLIGQLDRLLFKSKTKNFNKDEEATPTLTTTTPTTASDNLRHLIDSFSQRVTPVSETSDTMTKRGKKKANTLSSLDMIKINYDNNLLDSPSVTHIQNLLDGQQHQQARNLNNSWIDHECLRYSKIVTLNSKETKFFKGNFLYQTKSFLIKLFCTNIRGYVNTPHILKRIDHACPRFRTESKRSYS